MYVKKISEPKKGNSLNLLHFELVDENLPVHSFPKIEYFKNFYCTVWLGLSG